MPTLEITNEGNYIIKTFIYGKHVTYQLRGTGVTFLNNYGIEAGDKFSPKLLHELRERKLVFTNGSGTSEKLSTSPTINIQKHQSILQTATDVSRDTLAKSTRETGNAARSDFTKLIGSTKELNRRGTFFRKVCGKSHSYNRMKQGEFTLPGMAYCIVFHHWESCTIYIPPTIQTKCIGSCNLWEVWAFDIPKQVNATIYSWGVRIGHLVRGIS